MNKMTWTPTKAHSNHLERKSSQKLTPEHGVPVFGEEPLFGIVVQSAHWRDLWRMGFQDDFGLFHHIPDQERHQTRFDQ
jgi:hypothetical protein